MSADRPAVMLAAAAGLLLLSAAPADARAECTCRDGGAPSGPSCACPPAPSSYWAFRYGLTSGGLPSFLLADSLGTPTGASLPTTLAISASRGWALGPKAAVEAEGILRRLDLPTDGPGGTTSSDGRATFAGLVLNAIYEPLALNLPLGVVLLPSAGVGLGWGWLSAKAGALSGTGGGIASQMHVGVRTPLDERTSVGVGYQAFETEKLLLGGTPVGRFRSRMVVLELRVAP